ncbi:metal ABC transporter solute-binding protein, Zn/Mn family [Paenibacillus sp. y28]|uniref:metal ABC transporter solute-binding protein, Zn/Mn family n=1 Tax=Paenibacillus sp. y28 TaxID=3129110 RepID=UPI003019963E
MLALLLAGCSVSGSQFTSGSGKLKVTATTGMIADAVQHVGGAHVEVIGLMKAGVDPHLYKATSGDTKRLDQADIIFYNGLHLEGKMIDMLEKLAKKKPTVAVSRQLDQARLLKGDPETETEFDPHIWFDVHIWMSAVETIRDELVKLDAGNSEAYRTNAAAYLKQLEELDAYAKSQIGSIPQQSRVLVTAHDAFNYFGRAYNIEVTGLQGISTASEAGVKDVSKLRDFLIERQIKAVFVESSVPQKTVQSVIQGAKEKGHSISLGGELFSDAMGESGTPEGTYIGMVRHNVDTIVKALK